MDKDIINKQQPTIYRQGEVKTFARRQGRKLGVRHQDLVNNLLPKINPIDYFNSHNNQIIAEKWDKIALEIGFGSGENLILQAQNHPNTLYIGCEPYMNGVAKALIEIADHNLDNVLILPDDVKILLQNSPDISFDEIFILFPDPWPKTRHHKKRLVNKDFLSLLSKYLKNDGRMFISTDHPDYTIWIAEEIILVPSLDHSANTKDKLKTPDFLHTESKYEGKGRKWGHEIAHFTLKKAKEE